jgi:DNA-binding NarL/FixJ family response regulator
MTEIEPTLRVLCIDDQRAFKDALQLALSTEDGVACEHTAGTVDEALDSLREHEVDVVLMDLDLPETDGVEGTRRVKAAHPDVRVVVLTAMADLDTFVRVMAAGADGFVAKDSSLEVVLAAVRSSDEANLVLDDETLRSLRERVLPAGKAGRWSWTPDLTDREREVLALLAAGIDPQTIARQLGIRVHTCRGYVRNVLMKLGAHSQLEAVAVARRHGFLELDGVFDASQAPKASGY